MRKLLRGMLEQKRPNEFAKYLMDGIVKRRMPQRNWQKNAFRETRAVASMVDRFFRTSGKAQFTWTT